jgi:uncharacterized Tic20 family protein
MQIKDNNKNLQVELLYVRFNLLLFMLLRVVRLSVKKASYGNRVGIVLIFFCVLFSDALSVETTYIYVSNGRILPE